MNIFCAHELHQSDAKKLLIFARLPTIAWIRTHSATNSPAGEYENDVREKHAKRGINLHRFSSIAGATKPHLRTKKTTRVENKNVPNPTETYRGCFCPRFVSRCRVRPCFTTTILCGVLSPKLEPKRSVKFYPNIYKTIIWKDFLSLARAFNDHQRWMRTKKEKQSEEEIKAYR